MSFLVQFHVEGIGEDKILYYTVPSHFNLALWFIKLLCQ
jgi:hypothetical protein